MPKTLVINGVDFPIEGEEVIRDGETLPVIEAILALPGSVPVTLTAVGSTPAAAGASLSGQALTLQPASATQPGVMTAGAQTIGGAKTFSSTVAASNLSGTNTGDVSLGAIGAVPNANAASLTGQALVLQPADGTFGGVLTAGAQSIAGAKTFTGAISATNLSGTNTGDVTLAAVGAAPNANGATLTAQALNLEPASATEPGVVTAASQTFGGAKTFNGAVGMVVPPVLTTGAAGIAGTATLGAGGTVIVATTAVATGDRIMVSVDTPAGTLGIPSAPVASIINATSFVINSSNAADTSTVNWIITR